MTRIILKYAVIWLAGLIIGAPLLIWSLYEQKADACPAYSKVCV